MIRRCGFTLIELLVVIAIILVLAGLLLGAAGAVRRSAAVAGTTALVSSIHQACQVYRGEDKLRRFPPAVAAGVIYWGGAATASGGTPLVAGLLANCGLAIHGDHVVDATGGLKAVADAWRQPLLYQVDTGAGNAVVRPTDAAGAPVAVPGDAADWNPSGNRPYAYVWSYGLPGADNGLRANAAKWIYIKETSSP